MRPGFLAVMAAALLLTGPFALGAPADPIGIVTSMAGKVTITRGGETLRGKTNLKLFAGDAIQTGSNGKVGLILEDDTAISLGQNSRLALEKYLFHPSDKEFSFITRVFQGTVSILCGAIARLAPHQVRIETPYATVGVRGTHVLIRVD